MPTSVSRQGKVQVSGSRRVATAKSSAPSPEQSGGGWKAAPRGATSRAPSAVGNARSSRFDPRSNHLGDQLERWRALRADVVEPVPYRTPGRRSESQKMDDTLIGFGLAEPMWREFEAMGFKKTEAYLARTGLKDVDASRFTSLQAYGAGLERLQPKAQLVADLAKVVDVLRQGRSAEAALSKLPAAQADLIRRAPRSQTPLLERAVAVLEMELAPFITDSPAELVDVAPEKIQAGLEAAVLAHAKLLDQGDGATLREYLHHDSRFHILSTFGLLRELSVLDPARARAVGTVFATALHAVQRRAD